MADVSLPVRIAKIAADGYGASAISKKIYGDNKFREKVNYHLKKLVKKHVLRPILSKKSRRNPMIYTRGDDFWKYINTHPKADENGDHGGWFNVKNKPEGHNYQYSFKVLTPPRRRVPWQKVWCPNNPGADTEAIKRDIQPSPERYGSDIHRIWKMHPGDDTEKDVTVKEDIGKNSHTIVIMMHPEQFDNGHDLKQLDKIMMDRAIQVAGMLRRFGYELQLKFNSGPHYAFPVPREIAEIAMKYNIRTPDSYFDTSNSNSPGMGHMETRQRKIAEGWINASDDIGELKEIVKEQAKTVQILNVDLHQQREFARASVKFNTTIIQFLTSLVKDGVIDESVLSNIASQPERDADTGKPGVEVA